MANNALIGALRVEASLDSGKFVDGARKIRTESKATETQVKQSFGGLGAAVKAGIAGFVGAFSIGAFTQIVRSSLEYAASLGEVSQQLGVTTRDLQGFRYAASQNGVSQQQLDTGLQHLTETLGKVAAGAEKPTKALQAIGLTAKDVANVDTGDAFRKIADGLSKVEDRSSRAAIELALFGESGSRLDTLLAGGSEALDNLTDAAERLGIVLSDEQIQRADTTADKLDALKTVLEANIAGVVADNANAIYGLADAIIHLVAQIPNAINQLKGFYASFLNFSANVTEKFDQAVMSPINRFNPLAAPFRGDQMHANRVGNVEAERREANGIVQSIHQQGMRDAWERIRAGARSVTGNPRSTGNIPQFLTRPASAPRTARPRSGGRVGRAPVDRSEDVSAGFAREQMQADREILQAKQQLAGSAEERATIALQLIDLDHAMQAAEIDDRVRRAQKDAADGRITKDTLAEVEAQANILRAKNDQVARIKTEAEIEAQLARAEQAQFEASDQQRRFTVDALQAADQLATTAADHRRIQLQILDSEIEQKRLELEHEKQLAIRNGATADEIKVIQDKIDHLPAERAQGAANIHQNTQNPLEAWAAGVPKSADEITEAYQKIAANGLDAITDSIMDVISGTQSLKEAFTRLGQSIAQEILQMTIKMLIFRALSSALGLAAPAAPSLGSTGSTVISDSGFSFSGGGGFSGFADGGYVSGPGSGTSDDVPAMLSNGEYVVSAKAVARWLPVLESINSGKMPRMNDGGLVRAMPMPQVSLGAHMGVSSIDAGDMPPPVQIVTNIDATGADPAELSRVRAAVHQLNAEIPYRVVQAWYDARSRNVIR